MCVQYVHKQPPEVFFKKGVLKNFAKLTGKQKKKKETPTQMFSCEISKIKYSILAVIEIGPPVSESSTGSQQFMLPMILNTNLRKRESKIDYP